MGRLFFDIFSYIWECSLVYRRTGSSVVSLESAAFGGGRIQAGSGQEIQYFVNDHLGSTRLVVNASGTDLARYDYMPFGQSRNPDSRLHNNRYTYNGKEDQKDLGFSYLDYGWRMYDSRTGRWFKQDRFAEKYYPQSPYSYVGGNPIKNIDIKGDSMRIAHNEDVYLYQNDAVFLDGQEYEGRTKGFLKQIVKSLSYIGKTSEGERMISELCASPNIFTIIKSSNNEFKSSNIVKAYGQQHISENSPTFQMEGMDHVSGGSGGVIYWNPNGASLPTTAGMRNDPFIVLAHEMFHALDANRGTLVDGKYNGINKNEWQAVYRENVIRSQSGLPLRTYYQTTATSEGMKIGGTGPRMITPSNQPILPLWYQP